MVMHAVSSKDCLASALSFAERGWSVLPLHTNANGACSCGRDDCSSPGKHPKTRNGLKDATTDIEQIKRWWPEDSSLPGNIGIATGNGLVVVDVDGDEGFEALGDDRVEDLKSAPCVRTGRGFHYYFKTEMPVKTKPGFVNKVDIKADGGYVVAPPSLHVSGKRYEWLNEPNGELPDVPSWVFEGQKADGKKAVVAKPVDSVIPSGQRNDTLFRFAYGLRVRDVDYDSAMMLLRIENRRCVPPLADAELMKILDSAYRYETAGEVFNCTDLGNAKRLVAQHGNKIRYCFAWKKWLVWDDKTWHIDNNGQILRLAKDTIKNIYQEAAAIQDGEQRRAIGKWAITSESEHKIKSMANLAESEPGIPISPDQLDTNHYLLNCLNGTVDLRTGDLRPHNPQDYITKIIPFEYNSEATCPEWENFLKTIFMGNTDLIRYVQKAIGYSMTGDISAQCLFLLHGMGGNGKSTLLECISTLLGVYSETATFDTFSIRKNESIRNDLAKLKGARLVTASENEVTHWLSESVVKQLTGGDTITARFLFGEFFNFKPTFKIWLAANHKPNIRGTDHGIWRRIKLIPFEHTFSGSSKDDTFMERKLKPEMLGILAWAIRGCLEWQKEGLQEPGIVTQATNSYREEMDTIGSFISDCCVLMPDAKVQSGILYKAYQKWCEDSGETCVSSRQFGRRLPEKGLQSYQSSGNWWKGVGLKEMV